MNFKKKLKFIKIRILNLWLTANDWTLVRGVTAVASSTSAS